MYLFEHWLGWERDIISLRYTLKMIVGGVHISRSRIANWLEVVQIYVIQILVKVQELCDTTFQ